MSQESIFYFHHYCFPLYFAPAVSISKYTSLIELVARGFQEEIQPHSGSPKILKESNKLFLEIAANKGFNTASVDVRVEFLQSEELDRDIYLETPKNIKRKE